MDIREKIKDFLVRGIVCVKIGGVGGERGRGRLGIWGCLENCE